MKMDAEKLAKAYADLEKGFTFIDGMMDRIVKNAGDFLGFRFDECGDGKALVGFGHSLFFRWRFVIHNETGFGVLRAWCVGPCPGPCALNDDEDFYEIFFRCNGDVPILMKRLDQKTGDFYGNQIPDMEKLLTEIIEAFLAGDRFEE
jgi:hypothetical protein